MSFTKTNPFVVDTALTDVNLAKVWENTQLAHRLLCAGIASSAAIANTTAETAFNKQWTMPANTIDRVGSILVFRAAGVLSNTGTPTLDLKIKLGAVEIFRTATQTTVAGASNYPWMIEGRLLVRSLASGSQCKLGGLHHIRGSGGSTTPVYGPWDTSNLVTVDFTIANLLTFTAQWSVANASNTITMDAFSVEQLVPEATIA